jgi:alpha-beta hydrolase superfamily lysophospholipase
MEVMTGSFPTRDGVTLLTRRWEVADPRATLLVVHGASEHLGRWGHVAEFFGERGFEVFAYDHRGHGGSGGHRIHVERFEDYVGDLAQIVDHVEAARPLVIYAHSMGGLVATAYAESTGEQPDCYVLSAPALMANAPAPLRVAARILSRVTPSLRLKAPIKGHQLSRDTRIGDAYMADPLVHLEGTARWGAEFIGAMDRARADVGQIRVPALVIHGGDDTIVPPAASAPLAGVDGVDRRVFPGLRHEMHNEPERDEVLGFVAAWIDDRLNGR